MMRYGIYLLTFLFLFNSCNFIKNNPHINNPKAQKGILDLRDWNFEEQGAVKRKNFRRGWFRHF